MEFIDLKAQYGTLKTEIDDHIRRVLAHGQFIMGPEVAEFEEKLAAYVGRKHCISCANATDALQMVFMAYGIGNGDAVFCPDVTFVATIEPACVLGATPVFCDIQPDTYNMCPHSLEQQIQAVMKEGKIRPKAVVAVDLLGNPASLNEIKQICHKYDIIMIEDAAQAIGAIYSEKRCGAFGEIAVTSFFPAKPLGCYGDGGAVLVDDDALAEKIRSLRVHGKGPEGKYANVRIGVNSRLDTIQAAILLVKLDALERYEFQARQSVANQYNQAFIDKFVTPFVQSECLSVYAQYVLLAQDEKDRDRIVSALTKREIPNMVYYPYPQHLLPVFHSVNAYEELYANSLDYCRRTFSLPMHPYLSSQEIDSVISAVLESRVTHN